MNRWHQSLANGSRPPPVFGSKWGLPTPLVARPETLRWWEVEVEDMFWCGVGLESAVARSAHLRMVRFETFLTTLPH